MKRRWPFGEVGRRGSILNPHHRCIPCLARLGVHPALGQRLFGIDQRVLRKYGFGSLDRSEISRRAHDGRRVARRASGVSMKRIQAMVAREHQSETVAARRSDEGWALHHPEVKRWAANRNAKVTYLNSKHSPERTLVRATRTRIWKVARNGKGEARTIQLLGCTPAEFRSHLEQQFEPGMSWGNFGQWEIDHIRPCASFDLSDAEQVKLCFNYTNTRPMWMSHNRRKHSHWAGAHHRRDRVLTFDNSRQ